MTESEWLAGDSAADLYSHVKRRRRCSMRVRRLLLAAAVCRCIVRLQPNAVYAEVVSLLERAADVEATAQELRVMRFQVEAVRIPTRTPSESDASYPDEEFVAVVPFEAREILLVCLGEDVKKGYAGLLTRAARLRGLHARERAGERLPEIDPNRHSPELVCSGENFRVGQSAAEDEACSVIRDIFGNPFRPIAFDPAWRTVTATAIARGVYESRDFSAMPILADAIQDAGCDNDAILAHCRDPHQVHVRGCWVVDLVLGKA